MAAATAPASSTELSPSLLFLTIGCTHRLSASWARTVKRKEPKGEEQDSERAVFSGPARSETGKLEQIDEESKTANKLEHIDGRKR